MALGLYHVTVQRQDAITASEVCVFGSNQEHLVLARGQWLEALQIEDDELVLRCRVNVFASIRCIKRVPTQGDSSDNLAITSDSGNIVVLSYDCANARFTNVALEPIGRSGFRRTIPGEYLAVDPKGRALLVAAIEKLRIVYTLHSNGFSSPVEAHAGSTFCYSLVAMDRGYGNPAFASLERFRYSQKAVVMYELNLGLNHLVKVWTRPVSDDTDVIIPIPGGRDGPSGIVAVSGSTALYLEPVGGTVKHEIILPQPVVCSILAHAKRSEFFAILQTLDGKLLKLNLSDDGLAYVQFGSLASRAIDLQITKSGHLFANLETGDHVLIPITSLEPLELGEFTSMPSISPCVSSSLQRKQLTLASRYGRSESRLSVLEYGVNAEELVSSDLPGVPNAVFAAKRAIDDVGFGLIALSLEKTTTLLAVGEDGSVDETSEAETGLATQVSTLGLQLIDRALVQVHPMGFRSVSKQTVPWLAPKGSHVVACAFTPSQMLLVLSGKQIVYFEALEGIVVEAKQKINLPSSPTAVCFAAQSRGQVHSSSFYVSCDDETIRVFTVAGLKQEKLYNISAPAISMHHTNTLHVGHSDGTYSQLHGNGFWTRILGTDPVRLTPLSSGNIVALTSRTWLITEENVIPLRLSTSKLVAAHSFVTEDLDDAALGISGQSLVVFSAPSRGIGNKTSLRDIVLPSPVSRFTRHTEYLYAGGKESIFVMKNDITDRIHWSTPIDSPSIACCNVRFDSAKKEVLVVALRSVIHTYEYVGSPLGSETQLLHTTPVDQCTVLLPFQGTLLAAVNGNRLVMLDLGLKQLLLRGSIDLPNLVMIKTLRASRNRVFVGDSRQSITVLMYEQDEFSVLYTDPIARSVTAMVVLDHATICIGDQYGNIAILRCPESINSENHLELLAHFRITDGIVGLHKGVLSPVAGVDAIIYVGIQGTVGSLIPFASKEEMRLFEDLQFEVNGRFVNLVGRDSLALRCYYTPIKNVVDGDLCEYALTGSQRLPNSELDEIAEVLESSLGDILHRVVTFRDRSVF